MATDPSDALRQLNTSPSALIYSPIDPGTIRLVTLHKGVFGDKIYCDLEVAPLIDDLQYEALSYEWGDCSDLEAISLNGLPYHVTQNLFAALQHLRSETADRKMWIDAICINQIDLDERGHQVRGMHRIYATADRVVAWIGIEKNDVGKVINAILLAESKGFSRSNVEETVKQGWFLEMLYPFTKLIVRKYWRRLWVVQEIAHAKRVDLLCGPFTVPYYTFVVFLDWLGLMSSPTTADTDFRLNDICELTRLFVNFCPRESFKLPSTGQIPVSDMLRLITAKLCREPQDKLFGIHSLLPPDVQQGIPIDYSANIDNVFISATRTIIERDKSLLIALYKQAPSYFDFPSWALNWTTNSFIPPISSQQTFKAGGNGPSVYRFLDSTLETQAIRIGVVQSIDSDSRYLYQDDGRLLRLIISFGSNFFTRLQKYYQIDRNTCALTCIGGLDEPPGMKGLICAYVEKLLFNPTLVEKDEKVLSDSVNKLLRHLKSRALFTFQPATSNACNHTADLNDSFFEYFGLGTFDMLPGDIIVVMLGVNAPVILRNVGEEHYIIIGDAYIRMYMQGQTIIGFYGQENDLETFKLM